MSSQGEAVKAAIRKVEEIRSELEQLADQLENALAMVDPDHAGGT